MGEIRMNVNGVDVALDLPDNATSAQINAAIARSPAAGMVRAVDPNDPAERAAEAKREKARQEYARTARREAALERRMRKKLEIVVYGRGGNLSLSQAEAEFLLHVLGAFGAGEDE